MRRYRADGLRGGSRDQLSPDAATVRQHTTARHTFSILYHARPFARLTLRSFIVTLAGLRCASGETSAQTVTQTRRPLKPRSLKR